MTGNESGSLYELGAHGKTVDGSANDVRGRTVKDNGGTVIGKVGGLLLDYKEKKVRILVVEQGGFIGLGHKAVLIPVEAIARVTEDDVWVDQTHERVGSAPPYSPDLIDDWSFHSRIFRHYGYPPYWAE